MVFVVDTSGSVGIDNFLMVKEFIKQIIRVFDINTDHTRVGLITFSDSPILQFNLSAYADVDNLSVAIDKVTYSQGGTDTGLRFKHHFIVLKIFNNCHILLYRIALAITLTINFNDELLLYQTFKL